MIGLNMTANVQYIAQMWSLLSTCRTASMKFVLLKLIKKMNIGISCHALLTGNTGIFMFIFSSNLFDFI